MFGSQNVMSHVRKLSHQVTGLYCLVFLLSYGRSPATPDTVTRSWSLLHSIISRLRYTGPLSAKHNNYLAD
jgi:hypothetical protein